MSIVLTADCRWCSVSGRYFRIHWDIEIAPDSHFLVTGLDLSLDPLSERLFHNSPTDISYPLFGTLFDLDWIREVSENSWITSQKLKHAVDAETLILWDLEMPDTISFNDFKT